MKIIHTIDIPIDAIYVAPRLREVDPHWVEALGVEISRDGQKTPITVTRDNSGDYRLIAGMHRLAAATAVGLATIRAEVVDGKEAELRLVEVDENLLRRELNALDRAVFMKVRKDIHEELYPETRHGAHGGRGAKRNETENFSFSKTTAEKIGLGERCVRRACRIGSLPEDVLSELRGSPLENKEGELYSLTQVEPKHLSTVVSALLREESPAPSVTAARDEIAGKPPKSEKSKDDVDLLKLQEIYSRASRKTRDAFNKWREAQG